MHRRWAFPLLSIVVSGSAAAQPEPLADVPSWIRALQMERPHEPIELSDLLQIENGTSINTPDRWAQRRREIDAKWRSFLGHLPEPRCPLDPQTLESTRLADGVLRRKLRIQVEPEVRMECYLFLPAGRGPFPACICLHSTTDETIDQPSGLGKDPTKAFALDLARRGYVTIAPRNFLWDYRGQPDIRSATRAFLEAYPRVKGMAKMIHDASRCVDFLETLPVVRRDAIGAIGHSLGAKEVTFLQAFDARVACGVSSEGGVGLGFSNYHDPWYLGETIRSPDFERSAHEVVALIAPRPWLLIGGNSADGDRSWPFVRAVLPVYRRLGRPDAVGLFVHGDGHAMPDSARDIAYRWLDYHLKPAR